MPSKTRARFEALAVERHSSRGDTRSGDPNKLVEVSSSVKKKQVGLDEVINAIQNHFSLAINGLAVKESENQAFRVSCRLPNRIL